MQFIPIDDSTMGGNDPTTSLVFENDNDVMNVDNESSYSRPSFSTFPHSNNNQHELLECMTETSKRQHPQPQQHGSIKHYHHQQLYDYGMKQQQPQPQKMNQSSLFSMLPGPLRNEEFHSSFMTDDDNDNMDQNDHQHIEDELMLFNPVPPTSSIPSLTPSLPESLTPSEDAMLQAAASESASLQDLIGNAFETHHQNVPSATSSSEMLLGGVTSLSSPPPQAAAMTSPTPIHNTPLDGTNWNDTPAAMDQSFSGPSTPSNSNHKNYQDTACTTTTTTTTNNSPGPKFRPHQNAQWHEQFQKLVDFKNENGHCCVPITYKDQMLARWVKRQRYQYKQYQDTKMNSSSSSPGPAVIDDERIQLLESIGFIWDAHSAQWQEKWNELAAYTREHGHCHIPAHDPEILQLCTWAKCQRRQYKLMQSGKPSNMTEERVEKLNMLGFVWSLRHPNNTSTNHCISSSSNRNT